MALQYPPSSDGGDPVTLDEAKAHVREDLVDADNDAYLTGLITVARKHVEFFAQRSFLNTTWVENMDRFPEVIRPQRSPLSSVTSIQYVDTDGTTQTWVASNYRTDTTSEPGRVTRAWGVAWPSIREITNAVTMTYVSGYGSSNSDVPVEFLHAIKWLTAEMYEERDPGLTDRASQAFARKWQRLAGMRRIRVA